MDLYLINGQDGISLPEMIDWDIKLCDSDINEEVGVNNFMGLDYDLPSLDIEDEPNALWTQPYSANSNSSFELDFLGEGASALMVNPSSVMPFVSSHRGVTISEVEVNDDEEEPTQRASDEEIKSVSTSIKIEKVWSETEDIKVEVVEEEEEEDKPEDVSEAKVNVEELSEENIIISSSRQTQEILSLPVEYINVAMDNAFIEIAPLKKMTPQKRQAHPFVDDGDMKVYPKPAYSYSCLIAMALKNSQTGSLPVSEIYSFMCHHFPYFKTAPNGWKNSVRHNLSLNKCFEKIEKPHGSANSGSQRKGCLWAMNPAKISKMDEEVAKWSRKDPSAIKKAMVCPDNLELLERGDLKDEAAFDEEEVEEDAEEVKEEETEEEFGIDVEDERISPIDDDSDDEISRIPPSLQPFEPKFAHFNRHKVVAKSRDLTERAIDLNTDMDFEISDGICDDLDLSDTRTLLGLNESTPIYAVDPIDENMLIELPLVKRPRVQGNYIYQPMLNVKRHNISGFRSIKIKSP